MLKKHLGVFDAFLPESFFVLFPLWRRMAAKRVVRVSWVWSWTGGGYLRGVRGILSFKLTTNTMEVSGKCGAEEVQDCLFVDLEQAESMSCRVSNFFSCGLDAFQGSFPIGFFSRCRAALPNDVFCFRRQLHRNGGSNWQTKCWYQNYLEHVRAFNM